jgi:hypothetical protein
MNIKILKYFCNFKTMEQRFQNVFLPLNLKQDWVKKEIDHLF